MAVICGCALCATGGGFEATDLGSEGAGAGGKPSFSSEQAGEQITRNVSSNYLPGFPSSLSLTYAYRSTETAPPPPPGLVNWIGGLNTDMGGFEKFNATQIEIMEAMVSMVRDIANISLTRVGSGTVGDSAYSDGAQILIGNYTTGAATSYSGWGSRIFYLENGVYTRAGKVWIDGSDPTFGNPTSFNAAPSLFVHELMHTLGLSHPGNYNVTDPGYSYDASAVYQQDSRQYTVMSYFDESETWADWANNRPMTPMIHDIAALQQLYGANLSTRTGDTVYGFNGNTGYDAMTFTAAASRRVFSIWDAGGKDTIDTSGFATSSTLDLREEAFSSAGTRSDGGLMIHNIAIARGAVIENAIGGSGADSLIGNGVANLLVGNGGNDTLVGDLGNDTLDGGAGDDDLSGGEGNDELRGDAGTDSLNGGAGDDALDGGSGPNVLDGGTGNDTLVGGGETDFLYGGDGDDVVYASAGDDLIRPDGGNDLIYGGAGKDLVRYAGLRAETTVTRNADGSYTVSGATSGTDQLFEIERIAFEGAGAFVLDATSILMPLAQELKNAAYQPMDSATLVYRLYAAAYARTPDEGGFVYWANRVLVGDVNAEVLAQQFRLAPEFTQKYGSSLDDRTYTDKLYSNVLGRPSDQGGLDFWTSHLTQSYYNRDQLMAVFAVSPENVTRTTPDVTDGYWVI